MKKDKRLVTVKKEDTVRIMRSVQDGRLDYYIPISRVKTLFEQGKIFFECNNERYMSADGTKVKGLKIVRYLDRYVVKDIE